MLSEPPSSLILRVELPDTLPGNVRYENSQGTHWHKRLEDLDSLYSTESLWKQVSRDSQGSSAILRSVGSSLCGWLIDERARRLLEEHHEKWSSQEGTPRGRIELASSPRLASWPWELVWLSSLGPLGTCSSLTFARKKSVDNGPTVPAAHQLTVHFVGVRHEADDRYHALATAQEVDALSEILQSSPGASRFSVQLDSEGRWHELEDKYAREGAPDVFHFAGHGVKGGEGLVFQGLNGKVLKVPTEAIVTSLADTTARRRARLVFLNACFTSDAQAPEPQPFGPIAEQLVDRGVPAAVAISTQIKDQAALLLAQEVYSSLAEGAPIDVAVQSARRRLLTQNAGPEWAFTTLMLSASPEQLLLTASRPLARLAADVWLDFGHREQVSRLQLFLAARNPAVFIIHGAAGAGHGHMIRQIIRSASMRGRIFQPIPDLQWFGVSDSELNRQRLLGVIASAFKIPDSGEATDLLKRIAEAVAARSADVTALVLGFTEPIDLLSDDDIQVLMTLVRELWEEILEAARKRRELLGHDGLPVFLFLPLRYPDPNRAPSEARDRAARRQERVQEAVEQLAQPRRLEGPALVRPLPPLQDFGVDEIQLFLEVTGLRDAAAARAWAEERVGLDDNETILAALQQLVNRGA